MSTIDPTSQSQLDSILKKLGVQQEKDGSRGNKDTLGQSDFLKLMTTQLQNPHCSWQLSNHLNLPATPCNRVMPSGPGQTHHRSQTPSPGP